MTGKSVKSVNSLALEKLAELGDADWSKIILELTDYSLWKFRRLRWKMALPKGNEAKDVAMGAITSLLAGERNWDPSREPDLLKFLKDVVDSKCSNLITSVEYAEALPARKSGDDVSEPLAAVPDANQDTEQLTIEREAREKIWECVNGDDELEEILVYLEEEFNPLEIAKELGIPVSEVNNRLRRLRRHLSSVESELRGN